LTHINAAGDQYSGRLLVGLLASRRFDRRVVAIPVSAAGSGNCAVYDTAIDPPKRLEEGTSTEGNQPLNERGRVIFVASVRPDIVGD